MRRLRVALACFIVLATSLIAIPQQAQATTPQFSSSPAQPQGWPKDYSGITSTSLNAAFEDRVFALNCNIFSNQPSVVFSDLSQSIPRKTTSVAANHQGYNAQCVDTQGESNRRATLSPDGTSYLNTSSGNQQTKLVAYKNNSLLWEQALNTTTNCASNSYPSYSLSLTSMTVGADGNVYGILQPLDQGSATCGQWIAKYDSATGDEIERIQLTNSYNWNVSRLWSYSDSLVVVDQNGVYRAFDYNLNENTEEQYAFQLDSGSRVVKLIANNSKRVFAIITTNGTSVTTYKYHDSASNGSMTGVYSDEFLHSPGENGEIIAYSQALNATWKLNIDENTEEYTNLYVQNDLPSSSLLSYHEDTNGNGIAVQYRWNSTGDSKLEVSEIDSLSKVRTPLFTAHEESIDGYLLYGNISERNFYGDSMYISLCGNGCVGTPANSDIKLHKITLTSSLVSDRNEQYTATSSDRSYAAFGDSFSSGEGANSYIVGSDVPGVNTCHRSTSAYSVLLDQDPTMELDLQAFAACSGAVTSNLTDSGQHNEPKQLAKPGAEEPDVATITVGGNNIGFKEFATACVLDLCDFTSDAYTDTVAKINLLDSSSTENNLADTYGAILAQMPEDGNLYVVNYPMLVPDPTGRSTVDLQCPYLERGPMAGSINTNPWGNGEGAFDIVARLNAKIESVVVGLQLNGEDRIHYVNVADAFEGHDVCALINPYANGANWTALGDLNSIFHPNAAGQAAMAEVIKDAISNN